MKIQAGKRYWRRDGVLSGWIRKRPASSVMPFADTISDVSYTSHGEFFIDGYVSPYDLVKEYKPTKPRPTALDKAMSQVETLLRQRGVLRAPSLDRALERLIATYKRSKARKK